MRELDENTKEVIKPIIARLKLLGVIEIKMHYNGSGDSGSIEDDICLHIGQGNTLENGGLNTAEANAFLDFGYALLEQEYGGWEIDDGSTGTITFDLKTNKVKLHHGQHITDTRYEYNEFDL